jgi:hypothetical protein
VPKCGDEGWQTDVSREPAVDEACDDASEDSAADRGQRSPVRVLHDHGGDSAGQSQHGTDGKVDVAIGHHKGEADSEKRDLGEREQNRKAVVEAAPEVGPGP